MNYYITETDSLGSEIESRLATQEEIAEKIDHWVYGKWGISDFSGMLNDYMPQNNGCTYGTLCRQVATARIEEISFNMTCKHLGLRPMNITYVSDAFSMRNRDKVHLIKLPMIKGHSKNGDPIIEYEKIASFPKEGKALDSISIDGNGTNLPKHHHALRRKVFADYPDEFDMGEIFRNYLMNASMKPDHVYERNSDNHEAKKDTDEADLSRARPPADWYYPLYLLNFLTGRMVLFETYENPAGEVGKIREHFRHTMDMIRKELGLYPLVVEIPPLSMPMMYINQAFFGKDWEPEIHFPSFNDDCKIIDIFSNFADQAIALGK